LTGAFICSFVHLIDVWSHVF